MSFQEKDLEELIVGLLGDIESFEYVHGDNLERTLDNVLLEDDLSKFLSKRYEDDAITEGEIDALSTYQVVGDYPVVSIPNGAKNAKEAITHFRVFERFKSNTLLECILETGRTHQIRVHLAYIGYPVSNDATYNKKKATSFGQMLHSKSIKFTHPRTNKEMYFEIETPKEFKNKLQELEKEEN